MRLSRLDVTVLAVAVAVILTVAASLILIQPPSAPLRVAYLSPALAAPQNIWVVNPSDLTSARQVARQHLQAGGDDAEILGVGRLEFEPLGGGHQAASFTRSISAPHAASFSSSRS